MSITQDIVTANGRNDGKPRRQPRLGVAKGTPPPATPVEKSGPPPFWYELVQPPDTRNRADTARTHQRREDRGQVVPYTGIIVTRTGSGIPRANRRAAGNRRFDAGRLVLHRTRHTLVDGGSRPSVERRRAERAARKASRTTDAAAVSS